MPSKFVNEFFEKIIKSNFVNYSDTNNFNEISKYLEELTERERSSLFSDSFWNRYPSRSSANILDIRYYGPVINDIIEHIYENKDIYKKTYKSLKKKSEGIILYFCINTFHGKDIINLSKRGVNSFDERVRRRAVSILPTNMLVPLLSDPCYGIRVMARKRIGVYANPRVFLTSKRNESIKHLAIKGLDLKQEEIKNLISEIENNKFMSKYNQYLQLKTLFDKIGKDDLMFYMNTSDLSSRMKKYFEKRMM